MVNCFVSLASVAACENAREESRNIYVEINRIRFVQFVFGNSRSRHPLRPRAGSARCVIMWHIRLLHVPFADWLRRHYIVGQRSLVAGHNRRFDRKRPIPHFVHHIDGICGKWRPPDVPHRRRRNRASVFHHLPAPECLCIDHVRNVCDACIARMGHVFHIGAHRSSRCRRSNATHATTFFAVPILRVAGKAHRQCVHSVNSATNRDHRRSKSIES